MRIPALHTPVPTPGSTFDHRRSIVSWLDDQAEKLEATGQRDSATVIRAQASSVAAMVDVRAGRDHIASPVTAIIRQTVATFGNASYAEVVAPSKGTLGVIRVRFAAMWVAKKRLGWSDERMVADFHRDRSTIAHGIERAEEMRGSDAWFRALTDALRAQDIRCEHCQMPLIPA